MLSGFCSENSNSQRAAPERAAGAAHAGAACSNTHPLSRPHAPPLPTPHHLPSSLLLYSSFLRHVIPHTLQAGAPHAIIVELSTEPRSREGWQGVGGSVQLVLVAENTKEQAEWQAFLQTIATAYRNCHLTVVDGYNYVQQQNALFPNGTEAFQAFLQNIVGQIITLNNIYARIVTAVDNNDQKLIVFLTGRIFYLVAKFEPIEATGFSFEENRALKIFEFAEKALMMQSNINSGKMVLPESNQDEVALLAKREKEMQEYIERFYEQEETTPSFERILQAYSDFYNKSRKAHPIVMADGSSKF